MAFSRKPRDPRYNLNREQLKAEVVRLRAREGRSFQEIKEALGLSDKSMAHVLLKEALADVREQYLEDAADVLQLELERLDVATATVLDLIANGAPATRLNAIDRLVKLQDRRAKYLGLDTPIRVELPESVNPVQNLLQDAAGALLVAQAEAYVAKAQQTQD